MSMRKEKIITKDTPFEFINTLNDVAHSNNKNIVMPILYRVVDHFVQHEDGSVCIHFTPSFLEWDKNHNQIGEAL